MLIIRKSQTNNLIATVSMNKTLPNPYYLFSFQHIASKERVSFYPQVITSNVRYDKFRFVEAPTTNLSATPPEVFFEYLGQYYYAIYENITSGSTDINLAYNKLESGRAWVIVGDDNTQECFFEPYISNDEDFAQVIYVSEQEEACIYPTPSITPSPTTTPIPISPTPTPSITPTFTPTPSTTPPPVVINPATLNALWWIDFTDVATLNTGFGFVLSALDKISNVSFTAGLNGPLYNPTGYLGVSGTARTNAVQLTNASGSYSNITEYTWFARVYDDVVSQRGGKLLTITDINPAPVGGTYTQVADFNFNPYPPGPVWYFAAETTNGTATFDNDFSYTGYTNIALRFYDNGSKSRFELWENGVETTHIEVGSSTPLNVADPIFNLLYDGGIDFNTEQFFFDRKLSNGEMAQMFSYLANKY